MWHHFAPVAALIAAAVPQPATPAQQQAMFDAVRHLLEQAHVQPQDMPKQIISVEPDGPDRFRVHMQMVQGDGWFLLTFRGGRWEATGLPR
ncbi:MAG TPA: hypothetical protein VD973_18900 [Symbiobacteriaceae bacterium]|nr:hypothetical protein [Symbiobacteriaceae bacterium]